MTALIVVTTMLLGAAGVDIAAAAPVAADARIETAGGAPKDEFLHGEGCNFCAHTGYSDRIGVFELLKVSDEIKELVLQNAPHEKVRAVAVSQGMRTMFEDAVRLVEQDVIPISEIIRRVYLT